MTQGLLDFCGPRWLGSGYKQDRFNYGSQNLHSYLFLPWQSLYPFPFLLQSLWYYDGFFLNVPYWYFCLVHFLNISSNVSFLSGLETYWSWTPSRNSFPSLHLILWLMIDSWSPSLSLLHGFCTWSSLSICPQHFISLLSSLPDVSWKIWSLSPLFSERSLIFISYCHVVDWTWSTPTLFNALYAFPDTHCKPIVDFLM